MKKRKPSKVSQWLKYGQGLQPRAVIQDFGLRFFECQSCGVDVVMTNGERPNGWLADLFDSTRYTCESCLPRVTE